MAIADLFALPAFADRILGASGMVGTGADLLGWAREHFPGYDVRSLQGAVNQVLAGARAGASIAHMADDESAPRGSLGVNPEIPQQYQYGVAVDWVDPVSGARCHDFAVIDSMNRLSKADILSLAGEVVSRGEGESPNFAAGCDPADVSEVPGQIIYAFRRS